MQAPQIAVGQIIYFWKIFDLTKIFFFKCQRKSLALVVQIIMNAWTSLAWLVYHSLAGIWIYKIIFILIEFE